MLDLCVTFIMLAKPCSHSLLFCHVIVLLVLLCWCLWRRTRHLPLHKLGKSTVLVSRQLGICACLRNTSVAAETDNAVAALDRAQAMSDGDRGVVALKQSMQSLVHQSLGLGV